MKHNASAGSADRPAYLHQHYWARFEGAERTANRRKTATVTMAMAMAITMVMVIGDGVEYVAIQLRTWCFFSTSHFSHTCPSFPLPTRACLVWCLGSPQRIFHHIVY